MRNPQALYRRALCLCTITALTACDTSHLSPTAVEPRTRRANSPIGISLSIADVIPGLTPGTFSTFVANNSGRLTTEFWDNASADDAATSACNIGFYASGTLATDCQNQAPGSNANQGGFTKYWGDGVGGRDASGFAFDGARSYAVSLIGSYAGEASIVGWYTKFAGVYDFHPVPAWSGRTINSNLTIDAALTGGKPWGFFIRNEINPNTGGCGGPNTDCSDAEGGYTIIPFNQFAMFSNGDQSKFLIGTEDNALELLPNGYFRDSDYNDYIWSVIPAPEALGGQGCSPGYWKTHSVWPAPYTKTTLFLTAFGEDAFPGKTLQAVLATGGGGLTALGRQTVSALLNAQASGVSYEFTAAQVIAQFNAAFPGTDAAYSTLKDSFEALTDVNGRICPLN